MALEYIGNDRQVQRQQAIRRRMDWIARTAGVCNGSRLMLFDDPEQVGWQSVRRIAEEDGLVGFVWARETEIISAIARHLGTAWHTNRWQSYSGDAARTLPACRAISQARPLPPGWRFETRRAPSDREIGEVQALNGECKIFPYPAYFSRGEAVPILTALLRDETGALAATGSACMRYHAESRLVGCLFIGLIAVAPRCRGRGLGSLINALTLLESHQAFGWTRVHEQVHESNAPSRRMIEACGLTWHEALVAVTASRDAERFSK